MTTRNQVAGAVITGLCGLVMIYGGIKGLSKARAHAGNLEYNTSGIELIIESLETAGKILGSLALQGVGLSLAFGGPHYLLRRLNKNN